MPKQGRRAPGGSGGDAGGAAAGEGRRVEDEGGAESDGETARGGRSGPPHNPERRKKRSGWVDIPIIVVLALVLAILLQTFVARSFLIPSASMEQTLHGQNGHGDHVLVGKVVYDVTDPHPGDVVVFSAPHGWEKAKQLELVHCSSGLCHWWHQIGSEVGLTNSDEYDLIKRVIAVGGQTVSCCDAKNRVTVDGQPLDEPYLYYQPGIPARAVPNGSQYPGVANPPGKQAPFPKVTVPKGYLFVMGDNRNNSDDSRYQNGGGKGGLVPVGNVVGKARVKIWPPSHWGGVSAVDPQR
jgi:signal peptidase I